MKRNRIHEKAESGQSVIMTPFGIAFSFEVSSNYDGAPFGLEKRRKIAFRPADDGGNHRFSSGQERRRTVWFGNLVCKKACFEH